MPVEGALEGEELARFLAVVLERYGYDLRGYAPAPLRRRVRAALARQGISSWAELERRSQTDPALWPSVLTNLTVPVTAMFRDPPFYRLFRERVVPLLRDRTTLDVWHAGCATGEEVYSTAILLAEEGLLERCQIYATDLSPGALTQAKLGVYPADAVAAFSAGYRAAGGALELARYVTEAYGRVSIRDSLRSRVIFFQHDLVGDHVFGEMDFIFCRNVLIYFGPDLKERVVTKLGDSLRPGGFLCLGSSEHLATGDTSRFRDFAPAERIYRLGPPS